MRHVFPERTLAATRHGIEQPGTVRRWNGKVCFFVWNLTFISHSPSSFPHSQPQAVWSSRIRSFTLSRGSEPALKAFTVILTFFSLTATALHRNGLWSLFIQTPDTRHSSRLANTKLSPLTLTPVEIDQVWAFVAEQVDKNLVLNFRKWNLDSRLCQVTRVVVNRSLAMKC